MARAFRVVDHHGVHIHMLGNAVRQHHGEPLSIQSLVKVAVVAADDQKALYSLIQQIQRHQPLLLGVVLTVDHHHFFAIFGAGIADTAQKVGCLAGHDVRHDHPDQVAAVCFQAVG